MIVNLTKINILINIDMNDYENIHDFIHDILNTVLKETVIITANNPEFRINNSKFLDEFIWKLSELYYEILIEDKYRFCEYNNLLDLNICFELDPEDNSTFFSFEYS